MIHFSFIWVDYNYLLLGSGRGPDNEKGIHYITPVHELDYKDVAETGVSGEDSSNENDNLLSDNISDVRMDLTDDLLHMVCIVKPPEIYLYFIIG